MNSHKTKAFTLVELIIVITILAILTTIGFMSYQSYTADARDSSRITSLKTVYDGLTISYVKKQIYPTPDDYIDIVGVSKQGYVGDTVTRLIRGDLFKDPKDNTRFLYSLDYTGKNIELSGYLENKSKILISQNNNPFVNQAFAGNIDYTSRYIYTIGDKVGILLDSTTNSPVNERISTGNIDLSTDASNYIAVFSNNSTNSGTITGSGQALLNAIAIIQNSCVLGNTVVTNGGQISAYNTTSVAYNQICTPIQRTCNAGTLDGDTSYKYDTCYTACNTGYTLVGNSCLLTCNSSSTCYASTDTYVYHSTKGKLTKVSGIWQSSDGTYLGAHYDAWFADNNYATNTYYYEYSQYTKIDHRRVDNNQIRGTIIGTPNNRIREVGNSSRRAACCNGRAGGVPKSQTNPCYYGTAQIYQPWGNYWETATTSGCYNTTTGWIN
ncbi:MAG: type II secretion system protein [Candidatus Gracilibacteria bacterium]|nr:type II secretion system protein [Candidatus Gracilibacteria bacterium]